MSNCFSILDFIKFTEKATPSHHYSSTRLVKMHRGILLYTYHSFVLMLGFPSRTPASKNKLHWCAGEQKWASGVLYVKYDEETFRFFVNQISCFCCITAFTSPWPRKHATTTMLATLYDCCRPESTKILTHRNVHPSNLVVPVPIRFTDKGKTMLTGRSYKRHL